MVVNSKELLARINAEHIADDDKKKCPLNKQCIVKERCTECEDCFYKADKIVDEK